VLHETFRWFILSNDKRMNWCVWCYRQRQPMPKEYALWHKRSGLREQYFHVCVLPTLQTTVTKMWWITVSPKVVLMRKWRADVSFSYVKNRMHRYGPAKVTLHILFCTPCSRCKIYLEPNWLMLENGQTDKHTINKRYFANLYGNA
jgi:hypothetical protein